jgi:tetratricopeptide (TPR) repeat protein
MLAAAAFFVGAAPVRGNDDGPEQILPESRSSATDRPQSPSQNGVIPAAATAPVVEARRSPDAPAPSLSNGPPEAVGAAMASDTGDLPPQTATQPGAVQRQTPRVSDPVIRPSPSQQPGATQAGQIAKCGSAPKRAGSSIENLPPLPALAIDQMAFKGITPGVSTSGELTKLWGEGAKTQSQDGAVHLIYKIDPYRRVEVTVAEGKVAVIAVRLDKPFEPEALAKQLHLGDSVSVTVYDDAGAPLGQAIPERGILFSFAPDTKLVVQMLLEPIDAEPFVLRAGAQADAAPRRALRDLEYALSLDPRSARAHAVSGQILAASGRYDEALRSIQSAIELDPKELSHSLAKAEILGHLDRHAEAIVSVKSALAEANLSPLLKARALNQLGDLLAEGPDHDYQQAIELHLSAVKSAQPLVVDRKPQVRRDAKRIVIEAHLGAACDIGMGAWQQKEQTAARWINRADEFAKDLIKNDEGDPELRVHVARRALDARVGIEGRWDPSDWTSRSLEEGQRLILSANDPLRAERIQWEIGLALFDIAQLDQRHGLSEHSLADIDVTRKYLEEGARHRQECADDVYLFGRLFAHIGIIEATRRKSHSAAIAWFEKAAPLLDRPLPPPAAVNLGRHGETFVSMGISYWEAGRKDDAIRLTQKGAELMEQAVRRQLIDERAMAVPYGNLAAMHRDMGHSDEARNFAQIAAHYESAQHR